ncbi:MAG: hypothetical protein ACAI44_38750 [Candidatus Sericytochromatia bacterium]
MSTTQLAAGICISLSLGLPLLILLGLRSRGLKGLPIGLAGAAFALWLGLTALLAQRGLFQDFSGLPPRLMLVLLPPLAASLALTFHPRLRQLWFALPMSWLIGFQAFRLPVEIFLWLLAHAGVAPPQMSFEGRNWDILTGLTALPVAWLWQRYPQIRRRLALGWNLAGLALLLNIVLVAILSMPTPFQLLQPANTFVAQWPFVWLPALLVPLAYSGHFLALRQLGLERPARPEAPVRAENEAA